MELHTTVTIDEQKSVARIALSGALNTDTAPGFDEELQGVVAKGLDPGAALILLLVSAALTVATLLGQKYARVDRYQ